MTASFHELLEPPDSEKPREATGPRGASFRQLAVLQRVRHLEDLAPLAIEGVGNLRLHLRLHLAGGDRLDPLLVALPGGLERLDRVVHAPALADEAPEKESVLLWGAPHNRTYGARRFMWRQPPPSLGVPAETSGTLPITTAR